MIETITHITCAHCGGDNIISSYLEPDGTLEVIVFNRDAQLWFVCQKCKIEYKIPIKFI